MMDDYSSRPLNWEHDTMTVRQFSDSPCRGSGPGLRPRVSGLISKASGNRLWRYTACEISVADPGAVPGASTNFSPAATAGDLRGRTRLDARGKGKIRRPA